MRRTALPAATAFVAIAMAACAAVGAVGISLLAMVPPPAIPVLRWLSILMSADGRPPGVCS